MAQPDYAGFALILPQANITRETESVALSPVDVYPDGRCPLAALINARVNGKHLPPDMRYEKAYLDVTDKDGERHLYLIINSGIQPGDRHPDGYAVDIGKSIESLRLGQGLTGYSIAYPLGMRDVPLGRDSQLELHPVADEIVPKSRRPALGGPIPLGTINRIIGMQYATDRVVAIVEKVTDEILERLFPEDYEGIEVDNEGPNAPFLRDGESIPSVSDDPMWPPVLAKMGHFELEYLEFTQTLDMQEPRNAGATLS